MAGVYFIALPVVWLGVLGPEPLGRDLATVLGPTFAPLLGSFGKAAAIWFIMFNMFHGTLQPLGGRRAHARRSSPMTACCRASSSLRYKPTDCPWAATTLTAGSAIVFLHCRRSRLDDRRRQFHLSHRHLHAERRGLAAAARPARCGAALPRAARHHHARRGRRLDLARRRHPRLPAIRPADRPVRARLRLFGSRALRLAGHRGSPRDGPAGPRPDAPRQAHRRDAARADPRRRRLSRSRSTPCPPSTTRARVGARGHLRRRRPPHHQRRPRPARHDHLLGDGGRARPPSASTTGTLARFLARDGGARPRRSRGRACLGRHRAGRSQFPRRARRDGARASTCLQEEVRKAALSLGEAREQDAGRRAPSSWRGTKRSRFSPITTR